MYKICVRYTNKIKVNFLREAESNLKLGHHVIIMIIYRQISRDTFAYSLIIK